MKKSILSILAVCATIAVSAQTETDKVKQAVASVKSSVYIKQEGASIVTVDQLGTDGSLSIEQTASTNYNDITVDQNGSYDMVEINQKGSSNEITVNQTGTGAIQDDLNFIRINQDALSDNNEVNVTTGGTSNESYIFQLGVINSDITLVQVDFNNVATFEQNGGDNNSIVAIQTGTGSLNILEIDQNSGYNNIVKVSQNGGGNYFKIVQSGHDNTIEGAADTIGIAYGVQSGTSNYAVLTQSGYENKVVFSQVGNGTRTTFTQEGSSNFSVLIVQ